MIGSKPSFITIYTVSGQEHFIKNVITI